MVTLTACKMPQHEALKMVQRVRNCRTFVTYGIEVTVDTYEPTPGDDWLIIEVHADKPEQAGIGKGYILALMDQAAEAV